MGTRASPAGGKWQTFLTGPCLMFLFSTISVPFSRFTVSVMVPCGISAASDAVQLPGPGWTSVVTFIFMSCVPIATFT